jgi:perosamine synthetase
MKSPSVDELLVSGEVDLMSALQAIDRNAQGIVFICNADRQLIGVLTDGDARRAIVRGAALTEPVTQIMNASPVSCPVTTEPEELLSKLGRRGSSGGRSAATHIPLVDDGNRVVDYASNHRLRSIQIACPDLVGNELAYVADCVKTGWISSQGQYVREFERMLAEFCRVPHALAVSNGTVALHLALEALGVGDGDEVIVPDLTFAASVNAIIHAGATPVLVDIDRDTWTMDIEKTTAAVSVRTKAIMAVHLYGQPCDLDPLRDLAQKRGLWLIEDCAEALGSRYKGSPVGSFGDAAAFSFFGNKTITTGEGGMVLFRDAAVAGRARCLRDHGMSPSRRYWHEEVGFNYRMTNLQAAVGVAQMERIEDFLTRKRRLSAAYDRGFDGWPGVALRRSVPWADNVCWLYTLLVTDEAGLGRDELIAKLQLSGIETRPVFYLLHEMPPYRAFTGGRDYHVGADISRRGLSLPSAVTLSDEEADSVVRSIQGIIGTRRLMPVM